MDISQTVINTESGQAKVPITALSSIITNHERKILNGWLAYLLICNEQGKKPDREEYFTKIGLNAPVDKWRINEMIDQGCHLV